MTWLTKFVQQFLPEADLQAAMPAVAAIAAFGVLAVKDTEIPWILVAASGLAGAWAVWRAGRTGTDWPLYLLTAYLPFSFVLGDRFGFVVPGINLQNILLALTVWTYVVRRRAQGLPLIEAAPLLGLLGAFAALVGVSFLASVLRYGWWFAVDTAWPLIQWFKPILVLPVVFWVVRDRRAWHTVLGVMMTALIMVGLLALWEQRDRAGSSFDRSRVEGIAQQANRMGTCFATYMFLFLAWVLHSRRWARVLMAAPFLLMVRGMMVTLSRGAYVATAAGALVTCWFRNKLLFAALVLLALGALSQPQLLPRSVRDTIARTITAAHPPQNQPDAPLAEQIEPSAGRRLYMWEAALAVIREHPWTGTGYGTFYLYAPHYSKGRVSYVDAHNAFLSIAAELGLPSLAALLAIFGWLAWQARRVYRRATEIPAQVVALGVLGGMAALLAGNQFTSALNTEETMAYFWIMSALMLRAAAWQAERA